MKRILLLRHVESEANKAGVGLGRTDSPPTALGLRQLDATVAALREQKITRVVTSPLSRARLLAEAIAESHGVEAVACDELLELDVGRYGRPRVAGGSSSIRQVPRCLAE